MGGMGMGMGMGDMGMNGMGTIAPGMQMGGMPDASMGGMDGMGMSAMSSMQPMGADGGMGMGSMPMGDGGMGDMSAGMQPMGSMHGLNGMQPMGGMGDDGVGMSTIAPMGMPMGSMTGIQPMGGTGDDWMGVSAMQPMGSVAPGYPEFAPEGPPSMTNLPIGRFVPGQREEHVYRHLFQKATRGDNSGYISGKQAKQMFVSTGCSRKALHEIWAFADLMQEGRLDFGSFCVACRMLSHAQAGLPFDPELLQVEPQQVLQLPGFMDDQRDRSMSQSRRAASRSASRSPRHTWTLTQRDKDKYLALFIATDTDRDGFVEGEQGKQLLSRSKLDNKQLSAVWDLADMDSDGRLRFEEFMIAMHCVTMIQKGHAVPKTIPQELLDAVRIVDDLNAPRKELMDTEPAKDAIQSEFVRKALGFAPDKRRRSYVSDPNCDDVVPKPQIDATEWTTQPPVEFPDVLKGVESRSRLFKPLQKPSQREFDIAGASALEKAWGTDAKVMADGKSPSVLTGLELEMVDQRQAMEKQFARRKDFDAQTTELKAQIDELLEQRAKQDIERQKLVTSCENFQDQISFLRDQIDDVSHDIRVMQESAVTASRGGAKNPIPSSNPGSTRDEQRDEILSQVRAEREILRSDQRTIDELRVELTRHVKDKLQKQTRQTVLLEKHRQAEQDRAMLLTAYEGERYKLLTIRGERLKLLEERTGLTAAKVELETRRDAKLQHKELVTREENAARNRDPFNAPMAFPAPTAGNWTEFGQGHAPRSSAPQWESFG